MRCLTYSQPQPCTTVGRSTFSFDPSSRFVLCRRVHITRATLMELGGKFEVEDGNGGERDEVLAKLNVETFLIIPPKVGSKICNE